MPQYDGRLELTWTNKPLRLLAHDDGRYEWLKASDYRVAEVRLLHDEATVGAVGKKRAKDNLLIRGDALNALTSLAQLPEFAGEYLGKVKLVYIDPPFNTGEAFEHYDDNLEHSVWLTMMRDRLQQIEKLLAPDGSVWVHLNDDEAHYAKVLMDDLFGRANFVATFIWQKVDSPNDNKVPITTDHDYILCYSKNPGGTDFPQKPDESIAEAYHSRDARTDRRYRDRLLKKNGKNSLRKDRRTMWYPIVGPNGVEVWPIHDDGREANWASGKTAVMRWLDEDKNVDDPMDASIQWKERPGTFERIRPDLADGEEDDAKPRWRLNPDGVHWVPYTREWAPETPTRPWPTIWTTSPESTAQAMAADALAGVAADDDTPAIQTLREIASLSAPADVKTTRQAKGHLRKLFPGVSPFATPKPEELMARVLEIATNEGEIVLDCFAGSGSTLTVAHKLGRRWVGIEWEAATMETFTVPRLSKVVTGEDEWGISDEVGWEGGGGFRVLDVAPSMFESDEGLVFLASWMTNGKLAEATAAQLGFEFELDPPFSGRKGRARLAVVDGVVNEAVVRLLVSALPERERVVICGTGIDTEARPILRELRPGSTLRKIPAALLDEYRSSRELRLQLDVVETPELVEAPT